ELREGEVGGRCGRCEYRQVCGGCRARAYAETGDLMGPDDSCAYDPPGDVEVIEPGGQVFYGQSAETLLSWSPDARERLNAIPSFVRGVVTTRIEKFAREKGYEHIDAEVMAEVRRSMPVDFSKKLPFFLQNGGRA
ncbi:MAG: radical SAM domain protein, coenzyme PQQ synthesis protein E, partial [Myxococcales bacterium]|nr:radical SAM domain protein, coenzyme PQQ synthesis protein E [Myxococcales bacterium]